MPPPRISLRVAGPADAGALELLAQLDSRPLPPGPHLVAECQDFLCVALSLASGEIVANPFVRTAEACELLRVHASQLQDPGPARRRSLRPRLLAVSG